VVSPRDLVREVQGYDSEPWEASETIRYHIYRIRQKIQAATGQTNVIRTVRGVGYTLAD
ncbi:MAG: winged helix-turn-helix domain-containing protein, partial [Anaerolineae bacterium]|nr:winged helix-turn-helix domain-containing protein [Anaerolineae bacterium]